MVSLAEKSTRKYSLTEIKRDFRRNRLIYLLALPVLAYLLIFHYWPMYGVIIAFKKFNPQFGILRSPWIGFKAFNDFFKSFYFWRLMRNTFALSFWGILFGFPAPILFALLLNEVKKTAFKKSIQTPSYLPHFVSLVVICGIIIDFTAQDGLINDIIEALGGTRANLLLKPERFRAIYISSGIWQELGWSTIIYLAALSAINPELYDAATIDGAGRLRQARHNAHDHHSVDSHPRSSDERGIRKSYPFVQSCGICYRGYYLKLCVQKRAARIQL